MNINFTPFQEILSNIAYSDKISIYRKGLSKDQYGATRNDEEKIVIENQKSKISFSEIDTPGDQSESNIPISRKVKIFTALDVDIKAGDRIVGFRNDIQIVEGIANDPNIFGTHQEITILEEDYN